MGPRFQIEIQREAVGARISENASWNVNVVVAGIVVDGHSVPEHFVEHFHQILHGIKADGACPLLGQKSQRLGVVND